MQFFDRAAVPPPDAFRSEAAKAERNRVVEYMQQSPQRQAQTTPPATHLTLGDDSVLQELSRLFRSKCAFCESKAPLNVHLFRPPKEAEPLAQSEFAHLYYVWLRTDWRNFYAICHRCATTCRGLFPVRSAQRGPLPTLDELMHFADENYGIWRWPHTDEALLLDPCEVRDFTPHFSADLSGGMQARSRRGAETIAAFGLDRDDLVRARAQSYERYLHLLRSELDRGLPPSVFDFEAIEFGGAWFLLLRRLVERIEHRTAQALDRTKDQLRKSLERAYRTPLGREAFAAALADIRTPANIGSARPRQRLYSGKIRQLSGIEVENFKALERLTLSLPSAIPADNISGREAEAAALLILGENAAGKSSILEAIALALCGCHGSA